MYVCVSQAEDQMRRESETTECAWVSVPLQLVVSFLMAGTRDVM